MIDIIFIYGKEEIEIKCQKFEIFEEVCAKFAKRVNKKYDDLLFIYKNSKINIDYYLTIEEQFRLKGDKNKIKILVFNNSNNKCYINFTYKERVIPIKYGENEILAHICTKLALKIKKKISDIYFLYNGDVLKKNDMKKKVKEILNNFDINRQIITILVQDIKELSENSEISISNDFVDEKIDSIQKDSTIQSDLFLNIIDRDEEDLKEEDRDDINIYFIYKGETIIIECEKNQKLSCVCKKFALKFNDKISSFNFIYNENILNKKDLKKTVKEQFNNLDEMDEIMKIKVEDNEDNNDNLKCVSFSEKKNFHLKTFLILLSQYSFITLLIWLGFHFKINEKLIKSKYIIISISLSIAAIIILMSFIINYLKGSNCLIICNIMYAICVVFFCLLLSYNIKEDIIFCSLCLICIEIIGLEIYSLLFNDYKLYIFGISSFIFYLIGIFLFYILWIKDIEKMIYISIFPIFMILYFIIVIFIFEKIYFFELNEIFYATSIFNYGICILFLLYFKKFFFICKKCIIYYISYNYNEVIKYFIRLFLNLIIQFILIISIAWIGFATGFHEYIIEDSKNFIWTFIITTIIIIIIICTLAKFYNSKTTSPFRHIYQFLYVIFMIIYVILLSKYIEEKYILCLLFVYFLDLISVEISFILFNSYAFFGIFLIIMNTISIFLFSYFLLKDYSLIIPFIIISVFIILYLCGFSNFIYKKIDLIDISFGVAILNYGKFGIIFSLVFGLLILIGYLIYLIVQCISFF